MSPKFQLRICKRRVKSLLHIQKRNLPIQLRLIFPQEAQWVLTLNAGEMSAPGLGQGQGQPPAPLNPKVKTLPLELPSLSTGKAAATENTSHFWRRTHPWISHRNQASGFTEVPSLDQTHALDCQPCHRAAGLPLDSHPSSSSRAAAIGPLEASGLSCK